jgi:pimeloyl-ACP methyl ester carboxylesterase
VAIDQHVEDLEGVRAVYGLDRMDIAGQSWGAVIALNYALKYPARVRRRTEYATTS